MFNIRGLVVVSALSPFIIASTLGFALTACAPQSRFRSPVNLSGAAAPEAPKTLPTGANGLSKEEQENADAFTAQTLGDPTTPEGQQALKTSKEIAEQIQSVQTFVDSNMNLTMTVTMISPEISKDDNAATAVPQIYNLSGNLAALVGDTAESKPLILTATERNGAADVTAKLSLNPGTLLSETDGQGIVLNASLQGLGKAPVVMTLNIDNGLKAAAISKENTAITEGALSRELEKNTATTAIVLMDLNEKAQSVNTVIDLDTEKGRIRLSSVLSGSKVLQTDSQSAKFFTSDNQLEPQGTVVELPNNNDFQTGIMKVEIPFTNKYKGNLQLAIGTAANLLVAYPEATADTATEPAAATDATTAVETATPTAAPAPATQTPAAQPKTAPPLNAPTNAPDTAPSKNVAADQTYSLSQTPSTIAIPKANAKDVAAAPTSSATLATQAPKPNIFVFKSNAKTNTINLYKVFQTPNQAYSCAVEKTELKANSKDSSLEPTTQILGPVEEFTFNMESSNLVISKDVGGRVVNRYGKAQMMLIKPECDPKEIERFSDLTKRQK